MKVLHLVSAPTMTGPADPALALAKAQRALGVDAQLACDTVRDGNMVQKVNDAEVPLVNDLHLCTKGGPLNGLSVLSDRRKLRVLSKEFDLIHAHTSHDHALATMAGSAATLVRSIHHPRAARKRGLQGVAYRKTDGFIFITEEHRELMKASYPNLSSKMVVVPGAVDADRFCPRVQGDILRREMNISPEALVIGMVARIKPGRGHTLLLEAFSSLETNAPKVLALIGKGEGLDEVKAEVSRLGIEAQVRFYGFRDEDLPQAIASCDVTVLLAEGNDASCRAVLESLACGVPVIGAAHPAIEEVLREGQVGWLIPKGDPQTLAYGLRRALSEVANQELSVRASMGERARTRILQRYTDRHRAEAVMAFYDRLPDKGSTA